jgi:hypothetical protein
MSEPTKTIDYPCVNHPNRDRKWSLGEGKDYCSECYVASEVPLKFVFHSDVEPWVKETYTSEEFCKTIAEVWKKSGRMPFITVHVFTRAEASELEWHLRWLERGYNKMEKQRPYYGYRAWADYWSNRIVILTDDTETTESLQWIFWHELGHICVRAAPLFERATQKENKRNEFGDYSWEDDEQHERCAEEQFVNHVATMMIGGKNLNRLWWRERVNEKLARELALKELMAQAGCGR